MPTIEINRQHGLPKPQARAAVERVARTLTERFAFEYRWDGDTLAFSHPGVDGSIVVEHDSVHVTATLGLLLLALKGAIEAEIHRHLDREFG